MKLLPYLLLAGAACAGARSEQWFEAGREAEARGERTDAVDLYRRAVAESPEDVKYRIALALAEEELRRASVPPVSLPVEQPAAPRIDPLAEIPVDLHFEDASLEEVFRTLGRMAGVNILFDEAYRDVRVSVDLRGLSLRSALELVAEIHGLFLHIE